MTSEAAKGDEAIKAKDYDSAIKHLTNALKSSQAPTWYLSRSTAYQRTNQHELALADADHATIIAFNRAKRELIATAQFRRALALYGLKRYGDARICLNWASKKNEKEKGLTNWLAIVKSAYDAAGGEDAENNKVTVTEIPNKPKVEEESKVENKKVKEPEEKSANTPASAPTLAPTPKEKIKHSWYQSTTSVTVEIMAKGVPKDKAEIKITSTNLEVSFPITGTNTTYDFTIDPFFSAVDSGKSSFRITPHKIEIVLQKGLAGTKWSTLENPNPSVESEAPLTSASQSVDTAGPVKPVEKAPVYPTSSKKGPTNWDKIDAGEENDSSNPDDFFKMLYKDADPDTKRAMMKSYQESNGTALSTVWSDVGKKTVETSPPDGMEAKKW